MKGTLVEDINCLHRTEQMLDLLLPPQRRKPQTLTMFGDASGPHAERAADVQTSIVNEPIPHGSRRRVLCPLLSGLLSATQPHWIPLKLSPLTIELEINPLFRQYLDVDNADQTSSEWSIEDAQIKGDLGHVDAFLADKVYGLVRNNGLQFSFPSFNTTLFRSLDIALIAD